MTWTTTPPAADGWYWCRLPEGDDLQLPVVAQVQAGYASFGDDYIDLADTAGWVWWSEQLAPPPT